MNQARELCIQPSIVVDTADCLYSVGSYSAAAMPADERWNAGGYALQLSLPRAALHASLVGRFDPWIRLNHPPPRARRRTMSRQPDGGGRRIYGASGRC